MKIKGDKTDGVNIETHEIEPLVAETIQASERGTGLQNVQVETDVNNATKKRKVDEPSFLSKLFFWWLIPIFWVGTKRQLLLSDLPLPSEKDSSVKLTDELERHWLLEEKLAERSGKLPSLRRVLFQTFFWKHIPMTILVFLHFLVTRPLQPYVMSLLLQYWNKNCTITLNEAFLYAILLVILSYMMCLFNHHATLGLRLFGMRIRVACSSLIYRKITIIKSTTSVQGRVINLLSNDVSKFDNAFTFVPHIWIGPIQLVLLLCMMYWQVGVSVIIAMAIIIAQTVPVQAYMGRFTARLRLQIAQATDERIKIISEIISGIRVIKMYAWEKPFEDTISKSRARELERITKSSYARGLYLSFMLFSERLTVFITLLVYSLLGNALTAEIVFPLAQYLNMLQYTLFSVMPETVTSLTEMLVSVDRINDFINHCNQNRLDGKQICQTILLKQKTETEKFELRKETVDPTIGTMIILSNVTAHWTSDDQKPAVDNMSMEIHRGQLCAIIGPVGEGKTSVLQIILGELKPKYGDVQVNGLLSYASQEPWLFVASIRDNILFGLSYNESRYNEVICVCALENDFQQFPYGDQTIVGERGTSLSGGQRARINLARAVYAEADIYLLDDPLSSVDSIVGRQLFEKCISGFLVNKTVILVTHQINYLKSVDLIFALNKGKVQQFESYDGLISSKDETFKNIEDIHDKELMDAKNSEIMEMMDEYKKEESGVDLTSNHINVKNGTSNKDDKLQEEFIESGMQNLSLFLKYCKATGGQLNIFIFAFIMILGQVSISACDYWITYWTNEAEKYENSMNETTTLSSSSNILNNSIDWDINSVMGKFTTKEYLFIYTGLIMLFVLLAMLRSVLFVRLAMNASGRLHNLMFHSLLHAVMKFFDTNPSGRILNRFSKDIGAIDEILPRVVFPMIQVFTMSLGILVLVSISMGWLLVPTFIISILFSFVLMVYLKSAQVIKRLEGITKSPVFSHVSETLAGLPTIRCFRANNAFIKTFDNLQDSHTSAWSQYLSSIATLGFWLETLTNIFLAIVAFSFLLIDASLVAPADCGLAISQAMILSRILHFGTLQLAEVISQMISVERVLQYTKIEIEDASKEADYVITENWPKDGDINIENLSLQYEEDQTLVLDDINLNIKSGWKVGIIGRTGAGKTSLVSALFRLNKYNGQIQIGGIDTNTIPIQGLRSKISIIPQEPVLFTASVRYNLDPFNEYKDIDLWTALEQVELKDSITSLDYAVSQSGSNFSVGQRQLLCLARALLKNNKIVVLDEATANVDPSTDLLIQRTIREKFADRTVLTIAHRLHTIMDSDRALVMREGRIVEFDHPYLLLTKNKQDFFQMVLETGSFQELYNIAKEKYTSRIVLSDDDYELA